MTDLATDNSIQPASAGARFRAAVAAEKPLQIAGAINAYAARMAARTGFKAIYLSGGGVAVVTLYCLSSPAVACTVDTWEPI